MDKGRNSASFGFVDFKNAFDSPSQPLISTVLNKIGVDKGVTQLIANLRSKWSVFYEVSNTDGVQRSNGLKIRNGLLQGDTLSPLLFCLLISPISYALNRQTAQLATFGNRSDPRNRNGHFHLIFMDDIKVVAPSKELLFQSLKTLARVAAAIGLRLNPSKCATIHLNQGENSIGQPMSIPTLGKAESYKYLGIHQNIQMMRRRPTLKSPQKSLSEYEQYGTGN
uniref:Reverse transcriptase domain-containing protein n=1 Tax=Ditylenchus dipsaci TaxID=166011 RepID=A0A915ETK6_9BILA